MKTPCCSPQSEPRPTPAAPAPTAILPVRLLSHDGMARLDGGAFLMGGEGPETWFADGEGPVRETWVDAFWIDETAVSNTDFAAFIDATGYVTDAEKFDWSFVHDSQLSTALRDAQAARRVNGLEWWYGIEGAWWRQPLGDGCDFDQLERRDHPVVHLSWNDACAYARWVGKRLPTEAEWEFAARGGLSQKIYPWGDDLQPDGGHLCNIWQGEFPGLDTGEDGYRGTAPARSFPPNGHGLYNMTGNVWEWVADWFSPHGARKAPRENPSGPGTGRNKVMRGGSFLCHASYCNRYRCSARSSNTPDTSAGHLGFRCAADA